MRRLPWWQTAVFYQLYPRSFYDSNGDGIGDLPGITQKLDYLVDLGVGALWLSPHYPSPLWDVGYDIADFQAVAPEYGTLADFQRFLDGAHRRGLRVILDLVLNHTSDQHPWFIEARAGRASPRRDWYIWRDPRPDGSPPNNWRSAFGGPAWTLDPLTGQYYYHFFFEQQPDLNWRNPQVQQAMFQAARFWLDRGVDGFRLDAIGAIYEHPALTDHACPVGDLELYRMTRQAADASGQDERLHTLVDTWKQLFQHQHDLPEVHDLLRALRAMVDEYPDRVLVGETEDLRYCGSGQDELHMVFNFPLMQYDRLTPARVRDNQAVRLAGILAGSWPANTLGNHDTGRVYTHFASGEHGAAWARLCLALMLTLPGAPFLYYGEEIGMTDLLLDDLNQFRDNMARWAYRMETELLGSTPRQALEYAARISRDKCRTPFQWTAAPHAGFCPPGAKPWLPVNPDFAQGVNVARQAPDPASLLNYYRRLLRLRQGAPALLAGDYTPLHTAAEDDCLAFTRRSADQACLVVLNMSPRAHDLAFDLPPFRAARRLFSTHRPAGQLDRLEAVALAPCEVYLAVLE